jgi:prephenate dehydrogenase
MTLANTVLDPRLPKEQALLCATGFRDTTRVASSSPEMWRDIALANRKNLSRALDTFIANAHEFRQALVKADGEAIEKFNATAKERRDRWVARFVAGSLE